MKTYLWVVSLLLTTGILNAQCPGCIDDGTIYQNGSSHYSTGEADAYFWEICSGDAVLESESDVKMVKVTCGSEESWLRLVRFDDGVCTEFCKKVCDKVCECPDVTGVDCLNIDVGECDILTASINSDCLPDDNCLDRITWRINLDGNVFTVNNTGSTLNWMFPTGEWDGKTLTVRAIVRLTNGQNCIYTETMILECPTCECPDDIPQDCLNISLEPCTTADFSLDANCLPEADCIESIRWRIGLGIHYDDITNNSTSLSWSFPPPPASGSWTGYNLVGQAFITLTSGDVCVYGNQIQDLVCPPMFNGDNPRAKMDNDRYPGNSEMLYPNPVKNGAYLEIQKADLINVEKMEIVNISGEHLLTLKNSENRIQIPATFQPGIYFLILKKKNGDELLKFIVQ